MRIASVGSKKIIYMDNPSSHDYYADSYSHYGVHEDMLKDAVRTRAYMDAILGNAALFRCALVSKAPDTGAAPCPTIVHIHRDKIVVDVGCGTGILSLFAAKAGARHVYAIEQSAVAERAMDIVAANGFTDRITVLRGRAEDVHLPVDQVGHAGSLCQAVMMHIYLVDGGGAGRDITDRCSLARWTSFFLNGWVTACSLRACCPACWWPGTVG